MKARGIVLGSIDYKETSRIVYLYTTEGKISVRAQGANKPKNGLLGFITTGNICEFVTSDSSFKSVLEYTIIDSILIKQKSLRVLDTIKVIFEVIRYLPDDINHLKTYSYIEKMLGELNEENHLKYLSIFLIKMTYNFGVMPRLRACTICNSTIDLCGFSVNTGGAICKKCGGALNIEELNIWSEYYYDKKEIAKYSEYDYKRLLKSLKDYYKRHIHIDLAI